MLLIIAVVAVVASWLIKAGPRQDSVRTLYGELSGLKDNRVEFEWRDIDTTFLDMDGTLLDLHYDNFFWQEHLPRRYAQICGRPEENVRNELMDRFRSLQGTLQWYSVDYWSQELGLDVPALKREVSHLIRVRPFVEEFLRSLRISGKRVVLVTNAHHFSLSLKFEHTGLQHWLDGIQTSHSFELPKEDPQFWDALQGAEPFDPKRTLLIDDNAAVLSSARLYGIGHLLTLLQPDSQCEPRTQADFPAITHFDEIMPGLEEPSVD